MTNEVLDPIDEANNLAAKWTEANEKAIRDLVPQEREEPEEDPECEICGDTFPAKRFALGYTCCVSCAKWSEDANNRRKKSYGYGEEY